MGLFDWLFQAFTGAPSEEDTLDLPPRRSDSLGGETSTAVLEELEPSAEVHEEERPPAPPQVGEQWWKPDGPCHTEPVVPERPELSVEALAFENHLVDHFDGHDLAMPGLPRVPERVLKQLRDPKCDFNRIADTIAEDQVVAGAVLRAVNSPLYRGVEEITSLSLAAARLGHKALRTIMMHQTMRAATFLNKGGSKELADAVWRRSVASACVMNGLSRFTKMGEEEAWLLGLMHDVGGVLVLQLAQSYGRVTGYRIDPDTFEYLCYECHQEFGELIAKAWNLPPRLTELLANHHTFPEADDPLRTARLMIQLTDMINAMLGYAPEESYDLLATPQVRDLGLADRDDFVPHLADLPLHVHDAMMYF